MNSIDTTKEIAKDERMKRVNVALNFFVPQLINGYIGKFGGKLISFHALSSEMKIDVRIELRGESQLQDLTIIYELSQEGDNIFVKPASIQTKREWINLLFAELIKQGAITPFQIL